jgi:two-component system nitrate/nitrite response regulator NarL
MRLSICDYHVVFAESLAHMLAAHGNDVVAVTHDPDQLVEALRRELVDVCLLDVVFGTVNAVDRLTDVRAASPGIPLVLLTGEVDAALLGAARAAGVRGIVDKRQPAAELIDLLNRVHAGDSVVLTPRAQPNPLRAGRHPANAAQRLAAFLTAREREVLCGLVRGDDTAKLARSMGIAATTARCHIQNVLTKLGAHSRLEAATSAVRHGLVDPETGDWLAPVHGQSPPGSTTGSGHRTVHGRWSSSGGRLDPLRPGGHGTPDQMSGFAVGA